MKNKKKRIIRVTLLSLLLVVAAAAVYIYKEYNRTHKDTRNLAPDYTVSANEIIREYESDERQSNRKYWDKILKIIGTVKAITLDEKGVADLLLGDTASASSVRCSIDSLHSEELVSLKKGDSVAVKGICTGFNADELLGSDVILVRSVIDKGH